jgi:hypothetical protein
MRFKIFLAAVFAAGLAASAAVAGGPPPDKGNGKREGTTTTAASTAPRSGKGRGSSEQRALGCRPTVALVLAGTVVGTPGANQFSMRVTRANRHGRELNGKQATIEVLPATKIRRRGPADLSDLRDGDWALVQARACRPSTRSPLRLVAKTVVAYPRTAARSASTSTSTTG